MERRALATRILRLTFQIPLLVIFLLLFESGYAQSWQKSFSAGWSVVGFIVGGLAPRWAARLFGLALCCSPMLGGNSLNLWITAVLLGSSLSEGIGAFAALKNCSTRYFGLSSAAKLGILGIGFLFLAYCGPAVSSLLRGIDVTVLADNYRLGGIGSVTDRLQSAEFVPLLEVLRSLAELVIAVLLLEYLCRREQQHRLFGDLQKGLSLGAGAASLVFLLQYFNVSPEFAVTRSAFWTFTGRYSASFTDPNSFGLIAGLLAPLLVLSFGKMRRWLFALPGALLAFFALWSGSRSFLLLLVFWFVGVLMIRHKRVSKRMLIGGACILSGALGLLVLPVFNEMIASLIPIPGLQRVLASLHYDRLSDVLSSRMVFWRIAVALWFKSPLTGIGLGWFYHSQAHVAAEIGIDLGEWRDNANNFYLQVLAEGGLLGLFLALCSLGCLGTAICSTRRSLRFASMYVSDWSGSVVCRFAVIPLFGLVLLFFIGPHLDFDEVRYLAVTYIAFAVCYSEISPRVPVGVLGRLLVAGLFAVPAVYATNFSFGAPLSRGFYPLEGLSDQAYRWTSATAEFAFCDTIDGPRQLEITAPRPDISEQPVQVRVFRTVRGRDEQIFEIALRRTDPVVFSLPATLESPDHLRIEVDPLWRPVNNSEAGDTRWLGVQLRWREGICERLAATR